MMASGARARLRAMAAASRHPPSSRTDKPRSEAFDEHERFAVPRNHRFTFPAGDGAEDLANRCRRRHDEPGRDGIPGFGMKGAAIVDAANVGGDKTGADEGDGDAVSSEFGSDRIGEGAYGEFAHRVRRRSRRGSPARNAANEDEIAVRFLYLWQPGVQSAEKPEDVGFELAAVVVERKPGEGTDDAEPGIGNDDVELAVGASRFSHGVLQIAVAGHIRGNDEGRLVPGVGYSAGEGVE